MANAWYRKGALSTACSVSLAGQSITPTQGGLTYSESRTLSGSAITFQYGRIGFSSRFNKD